MDSSEEKLVCRLCEVLSELVSEESGGQMVRCPSCETLAEFEEAHRIAALYFLRKAAYDVFDDIGRSTGSMKHVNYVKGDRSSISAPDFVLR